MVATTRRLTAPLFAGLVLTFALLVGPNAGAAARPTRAPRDVAGHVPGGYPGGPSTQPALLATPHCPVPPSTGNAPWQDPSFGAECQAQYVIDDLENPASPLYAHSPSGAASQSTLQRLEAALATGNNIDAANGSGHQPAGPVWAHRRRRHRRRRRRRAQLGPVVPQRADRRGVVGPAGRGGLRHDARERVPSHRPERRAGTR